METIIKDAIKEIDKFMSISKDQEVSNLLEKIKKFMADKNNPSPVKEAIVLKMPLLFILARGAKTKWQPDVVG